MPDYGGFVDKAREFADEHPDQVQEGVEKAGEFADQRTGGRFTDQIDQGEQRARDYLGQGGQDQQAGQDQSGGQDEYRSQDQSGEQDQYADRDQPGGQDQPGGW